MKSGRFNACTREAMLAVAVVDNGSSTLLQSFIKGANKQNKILNKSISNEYLPASSSMTKPTTQAEQ